MEKLSYEKCKKLKDAGFPQNWYDGCWFQDGRMSKPELYYRDDEFGYPVQKETTTAVRIPTLEELIDACMVNGRDFVLFSPNAVDPGEYYWGPSDKLWHAFSQLGNQQEETAGKTPLEAVANLWLKLQKAPK